MPKVFVHGNPETSFVWSPLVTELRARDVDDIVLLSPPGFGAPVPDGFGCTYLDYRRWLIAELEAIGEPVDLVGHDWGSGHVFGVAATRSDLVRSWAADCVGLLHPDYVWHTAATAWQTPGEGEAAVARLIGLSAETLVGFVGVPEGLAAEMADSTDQQMGVAILALYRSAVQPLMAELGDQLDGADWRPVLAINATADPYVSHELGTDVAERLGATTLTLDGCGHWWMWERPAVAANALVEFWTSIAWH